MGGIPPPCFNPPTPQIEVMTQPTTSHLIPLIPSLMRRARRMTRSRSEAEDVVQDTLLNLCQRMRDGAEIEDLPAYAMRTLSNGARRSWQRRQTEELEDDVATTAPDALLRLDCADTLSAIETLPDAQRDLMALLIEGETSPAAIAKRTGLPLGTVMSRLARARARLRLKLKTH